MAAIIQKIVENYKYANGDLADPRVKDWPLMSSPWLVVVIVGAYLYFSLDAGPRLMKNRPPFNVDKLIVVYDLFQIAISSWMAWEGYWHCFPTRYKFYCEPVDYSYDENSVYVAKLTWMYFMVKVLDLLDTVFFVLRKKNNQISFLHVYHHALMVLAVWFATKYFAGGHFVLLGQVNSGVHAVMYSYYLLANINPEYKKSMWWKKYITQLQILQFLVMCVQNYPTLLWGDCPVNYWLRLFLCIQDLVMLLLFTDFYRRAYCSKQSAD